MLRKYLLPILCCLCPLAGFSQTTPTHTAQLDSLLKRAYAAAELSFQQASSQQGSSQLATKKPWQLALFLAARQRSLQETLNEIYPQIRQGNVAIATVLDVFPNDPDAEDETVPDAILYVLYRQDNKIKQVKKTLSTRDYPDLLEAILKPLKKGQDNYYTGILIDAHSTGIHFVYGPSTYHYFSAKNLLRVLEKAQVHVDLMELYSCYMSSLVNNYVLARSARIDYLVASSDIALASKSFMYYRSLRFLNQPPAQVAVHSVQDRRQRFHFSELNLIRSTNAAALNLQTLQQPLSEYVRLYKELFPSKDTKTDEEQLDAFFKKVEKKPSSLDDIVWKQREFVRSHPAPQSDPLYNTQQAFITACNHLIKALKQSTLTQWCYSKQDDRVYDEFIPPDTDCLTSISVKRNQYQHLWK